MRRGREKPAKPPDLLWGELRGAPTLTPTAARLPEAGRCLICLTCAWTLGGPDQVHSQRGPVPLHRVLWEDLVLSSGPREPTQVSQAETGWSDLRVQRAHRAVKGASGQEWTVTEPLGGAGRRLTPFCFAVTSTLAQTGLLTLMGQGGRAVCGRWVVGEAA